VWHAGGVHSDTLRADGLPEPGGEPWRRPASREVDASAWVRVREDADGRLRRR
jgi:hypothetical protein